MGETLNLMFKKFIGEYASELSEARATENFKRPFGNLVRQDIAGKLRKVIPETYYKVKGSVGAGRWTDVPWIAVFDTRVTESAPKGVYIVYLLNKDSKTLYLTLNQGATDVAQESGTASEGRLTFTGIANTTNEKTTDVLKKRANEIREAIGGISDARYGPINCGSKAYDAGCIFYKEYHLENIPDDAVLTQDLLQFVSLYQKYYTLFLENTAEITPYPREEDEDFVPLSTKEAINSIKRYINAKGFTYGDGLIENFFLSLKTKPFVILAGTSGTGKTRLVKLFAEAIGAGYQLVPVHPDWNDGSDLFGHYDLNGNFIDGPVCKCFKLANERPDKPVFLCLDEMNLARVEYYLSDFLSVIESREKLADGTIQTSAIAQYKGGIPSNLYVVGTVNMDETTFPFSKKVLDRANTIEFSCVNLLPDFGFDDRDLEPLELPNDFLRTRYLVLTRDCADQKDLAKEICFELQKINDILVKANAQIGYRVRDEIVFYILNNHVEGDLISLNQALDNEIMQKILPRIQGSAAMIKDMMIDLFRVCMGDLSGVDKDSGTAGEQMLSLADSAKYSKSAKKIGYMMTRYEEDGFTSCWL